MVCSHDNLKQYVQRGYLDSIRRGAYCKHGSTPTFPAALAAARAPILQELLERCSSIKVKRLFFLLAEDLNLSWYADLDPSRIDLGSGNRVIDKDGTYRRKWLLTVKDWRNV